MTNPAVETTQSGEAADAVRVLQAELSGDYSEIRSAEVQLAEVILSAHAVTVSGRNALQDIQRQLVEAITNPVAALDTPSGERQFLLFLRGKVAEIQRIVDAGALTDEDHARLTRALGNGYLLPASGRDEMPAPAGEIGGTRSAEQGAGMVPALGSALGSLPQAAQGAAAAPAQGATGLAGAAAPLAGLASGLLDRSDEAGPHGDRSDAPTSDLGTDGEQGDDPESARDDSDDSADDGADDGAQEDENHDTDERPADPRSPDGSEPRQEAPAQTRPARLLQERP